MSLEDVLLKLTQAIEANTAAYGYLNATLPTEAPTAQAPSTGQATAKAKKVEELKAEIKANETASFKAQAEAETKVPDPATVKAAFVNLLDIDRAAGVAVLSSFNAAKLAEVPTDNIAEFYGAVLAKTAELRGPLVSDSVVAEEDILG